MIFICNIIIPYSFSFCRSSFCVFCISFFCLSISFNFLHIFRNSSWYNLSLLSSFLFVCWIVVLIVWYQFKVCKLIDKSTRDNSIFMFCVCIGIMAPLSVDFIYVLCFANFFYEKVYHFLFKIIKIVYVTERHWDVFAWSWWL